MKVLISSFGSIAKRHFRNVKELLPAAEVGVLKLHTKLAEGDSEGVDHFFYRMEDGISYKPDLLIVASPASEHIRIAVPFIELGIPSFIEKPLAGAADDLKKLSVIEKWPFVMVGYVLRFQPIFQDIKKIRSSSLLGRPLLADIHVGQYLPDWRPESDYRRGVSAQKKLGGGALLELSHEIDYATWLLGWPGSVYCSCSKISDLELDVEDHALLIFEPEQKHACKMSLRLDFLQRVPQMSFQIVGSEATMKADLINEEIKIFDVDNPKGRDFPVSKMSTGNEMYLRQFDAFFYQSLKGYRPRYPETEDFTDWAGIPSAEKVIEIVEKAKQSNQTGSRVPI